MSDKEKTIINYIVICISEFAKQKLITTKEAYNYLKAYKGLEFLNECYEAEHTVGLNDAIEDLTDIGIKQAEKLRDEIKEYNL